MEFDFPPLRLHLKAVIGAMQAYSGLLNLGMGSLDPQGQGTQQAEAGAVRIVLCCVGPPGAAGSQELMLSTALHPLLAGVFGFTEEQL